MQKLKWLIIISLVLSIGYAMSQDVWKRAEWFRKIKESNKTKSPVGPGESQDLNVKKSSAINYVNVYLFFPKKGTENPSGTYPNWYYYWKEGRVVPNLNQFGYISQDTYGVFTPPNKLEVGAAAADEHYPGGYTINNIAFGGAKGIDCCAEVCAHELYHKEVNDNWQTGGQWHTKYGARTTGSGGNDIDGDGLPNEYETNFVGSNPNNSDTFNVAGIRGAPEYASYGDQEYMAMVAGHGKTGVASKDWANPGKQSTPPY